MLDGQGRLLLKCLTFPELLEWCAASGESPRRAMQLWKWMYSEVHSAWINSLEETYGRPNGFSARWADALAADGAAGTTGLPGATVHGQLALQQVATAADGTRKLVFRALSGEAAGSSIETVLIPVQRDDTQRGRLTICVSSQVGCAMNCQFCFTGRMGLLGNLSTAQIVEQVVAARRYLAAQPGGAKPTNVVFMGMGEPLANMEAVLAAVEILSHTQGLGLSPRKITVSTVGLVPEIRTFLARSSAQLALSLHATTDEVRDWIVPLNRRYPLAELMAALREAYPRGVSATAGQPGAAAAGGAAIAGSGAGADGANGGGGAPCGPADPERRLMIEYTCLAGINDSEEDAWRLGRMLEQVQAKVNLIQFNPFAGTRFQASSVQAMRAMKRVLVEEFGMLCTVRESRGDDEMAACGQLGSPAKSPRGAVPLAEPPAKFAAALRPLLPAA